MKRIAFTAPLLGLVLLAGCGTSNTGSTPTPAPTVTVTTTVTATPTAKPLRADSLEDFRDQLIANGYACPSWEAMGDTAGKCDEMSVMVWEGSTTAEAKLFKLSVNAMLTTLQDAKREDVSLLVGENVAVRVSTADAETLRKTMGGTILGYVSGE